MSVTIIRPLHYAVESRSRAQVVCIFWTVLYSWLLASSQKYFSVVYVEDFILSPDTVTSPIHFWLVCPFVWLSDKQAAQGLWSTWRLFQKCGSWDKGTPAGVSKVLVGSVQHWILHLVAFFNVVDSPAGLVHFKPIDGSLPDIFFEEEDWCNLWKQL